jgi:acetoin utilization deacetylase AcuC-like enzyme
LSARTRGAGYMTAALLRLCPRLVLALEGGYNVSVSAECAAECVAVRASCPGPRRRPAHSVRWWQHG